MGKLTKMNNIIVTFVFVAVLFIYGILNIKPLFKIVKSTSSNTTIGVQAKLREIEKGFTESIVGRNYFIDFYGFSQKTLNKSVIGNFEFMKSNNEFMHMAMPKDSVDIHPFVDSIREFKKVLNKSNTPLIYVQVPARSITNTEKMGMNIASGEDIAINKAKNAVVSENIAYLDIAEKMNEAGFPAEKLFFKTDVHLSTQGEFFLCKEIVRALQNENLTFEQEQINKVFDIQNYNIDSRLFLGNLSRSTGKYYSKMDVFDNYVPKFPVNFSMINRVNGERRDGGFEDVFMNDYKNRSEITERTYWVTNYLQFGQPFYEFINHNQEQKKLLVICDSMGMRSIPLLSLLANKVTIVDIRFQGFNSYALDALNAEKYDAVILLHENSLFGSRIVRDVVKSPNAEIVSNNTPTTINRTSKYSVNITVKNTSSDSWSEEKQVRLCIWQDGKDYGYRQYLPEGVEINPGEQYTFRLDGFTAPPSKSTYIEFQMCQEGNTYFGEKERVDITVDS